MSMGPPVPVTVEGGVGGQKLFWLGNDEARFASIVDGLIGWRQPTRVAVTSVDRTNSRGSDRTTLRRSAPRRADLQPYYVGRPLQR